MWNLTTNRSSRWRFSRTTNFLQENAISLFSSCRAFVKVQEKNEAGRPPLLFEWYNRTRYSRTLYSVFRTYLCWRTMHVHFVLVTSMSSFAAFLTDILLTRGWDNGTDVLFRRNGRFSSYSYRRIRLAQSNVLIFPLHCTLLLVTLLLFVIIRQN